MSKRKHRRVRSSWQGCGCPEGAKKVTTCSTGGKVCRGRGWGCLGVGRTAKGRPIPRWVAAVCSSEAPVVPTARKRRPSIAPVALPRDNPDEVIVLPRRRRVRAKAA